MSGGGHKELLRDWHLELSAGQYRPPPRSTKTPARGIKPLRGIKLAHNIVLSMPAPTPPDKVLAAAKVFAREKFGAKHRYAMALHTHQQHPHVHLVVKAEGLDGRRLHIDKAMLREWRADFARMMRDQGIAANATPRTARGRNKGSETKCPLPNPKARNLLRVAREGRGCRARACQGPNDPRPGTREAQRDSEGGRGRLGCCRRHFGSSGRGRSGRRRPVLREESTARHDRPRATGGGVQSLREGAETRSDARGRLWAILCAGQDSVRSSQAE